MAVIATELTDFDLSWRDTSPKHAKNQDSLGGSMQKDDSREIWRFVEALPENSGFVSAYDLGATLMRRIASINFERGLMIRTRQIRWCWMGGAGVSWLESNA